MKENKKEYQKLILKILGIRPIAFNPLLAKALGSAKAGLLLSQLLYWTGKGSNPEWIYKTIEEIKEETGLSRNEQDTAIKICKKVGVLEVKVMGIPAKRHFKVNIEKIIELLKDQISLKENYKKTCTNSANKFAKNSQTNTENTTKNTNIDFSLQESDIIENNIAKVSPLEDFF